MRGSLWRVANCQMRSATREESMGAELVNRYLADVKADLLKTWGARKFVDVAFEGDPRFPTGDEEQDDEDEARRLADVDDELPVQADEPDTAEPEPLDAQSNASSANAAPTVSRRVSRRQRRQDTAASRDTSRDSSQVSEPQRERGPSLQSGTERTTPELGSVSRPARGPTYPFPFDQHRSSGSTHQPYFVENYYLEMDHQGKPDYSGIETQLFTAKEAEAHWSVAEESFFIKKAKRPGDEIDITQLAPEVQRRFTGP